MPRLAAGAKQFDVFFPCFDLLRNATFCCVLILSHLCTWGCYPAAALRPQINPAPLVIYSSGPVATSPTPIACSFSILPRSKTAGRSGRIVRSRCAPSPRPRPDRPIIFTATNDRLRNADQLRRSSVAPPEQTRQSHTKTLATAGEHQVFLAHLIHDVQYAIDAGVWSSRPA
jgi:hypothetical protein